MMKLGKQMLTFAIMVAASGYLVVYAVLLVAPFVPYLAAFAAVFAVGYVGRAAINRRRDW
jgi:uncharacterized membrane protein YjjB (DUF3815 family)